MEDVMKEAASQLAVADVAVGIVATEDESQAATLAELDRRIRELETAISEVRSVKASAGVGRKTASSMMASASNVDDALGSLSVEQRIAVKSGLMRAGLM